MLPYCSDDQLLAELTVVLSAGWELPSRPHRAKQVRHLLLVAQDQQVLTYAAAAQRLLHMLDDAFRQAEAAELISPDDEQGLRILFGTHPNYRTEPSPTVRREQAADFLVPAWATQRPKKFVETFQRRHQNRALRQALDCLRSAYGQKRVVEEWDYDVVAVHRTYVIGEKRQLRSERVLETIRPNHDDFDQCGSLHFEHVGGEVEFSYRALSDGLTVLTVHPDPQNTDFMQVRFKLPRSYSAGELCDIEFEQEIKHVAEVTQWPNYYVASQSSSEGVSLTMTAVFKFELPELIWWYVVDPYVDQRLLGPDSETMLKLGEGNAVSQSWSQAEKRMDYGLKWKWKD